MPRFIPRAAAEPSEEMVSRYGRPIARLLCIRGIEELSEAEAFLNPSAEQFQDPALLYGLTDALDIIRKAGENNQKIVVYGDYDADGICSCAILTLALRRLGYTVTTFTPLRAEGYGLNPDALRRIRERCDLLITVDLGITNHKEVQYAQSLGMTVIVTDHHTPTEIESPADVVVHPMLGNYPFPKLCGTGVAFKLAQALLGMEESADLLDIAAIGTVADLVPLQGENRVIVKLGLPLVNERRRPGIKALAEAAGLESEISSENIAFQLAPRLNASGRMGDAGEGVKLMLTEDEGEAQTIAEQLNEWNLLRKKKEEEVLNACENMIAEYDLIHEWGIILRGSNWHTGVLGLAAGRITQKYACPSCVLSKSGENQLSGSLRSVPGINIFKCLTACDDLLLHWGGHEAAAGITIREDLYEAFRQRLMAQFMQADPSCYLPRQDYDLSVSIKDLNEKLLSQIDRLAPFGFGNPSPLLATFGAKLEQRRTVGVDGRHLKLTFRQDTHLMDGIAFGKGELSSALPDTVDAVYSLIRNTYRGVTSLQVQVCELQPERMARLRMIREKPEDEAAQSLLRFLAQIPESVPEEQKDYLRESREEDSLQEIMETMERGHLLVAHSSQTAANLLARWQKLLPEDCFNPQHFPALLFCPDTLPAHGRWQHIWLMDGLIVPEEAAMWRNAFPGARVHAFPHSEALLSLVRLLDTERADWAKIYRAVKDREVFSFQRFSALCGMSCAKTLAALQVLSESGLIEYTELPFCKSLLPVEGKVNPEQFSKSYRRLKTLLSSSPVL